MMAQRIGRTWQWFRNRPLVFKFTMVSFVLIALPLAITGYLTYASYSSSIQRNVGKYQADFVRELTTNIDTFMNELNLLSLLPYQSPDIMDYLASGKKPGTPWTWDERVALEDLSKRVFTNGRVDVIGMYLYGISGVSYVHRPDGVPDTAGTSYKEEPWYGKASATGKGIFLGSHEVKSSRASGYQVFSIVRKIRSIDTGEDLGYFQLDVEVRAIRNKINQLSMNNNENVAIFDSDNQLVYKNHDTFELDESSYRGTGTVIVDRNGQKELLTYHTSPLTGWTTIETVPVSVLTRDTVAVRNYFVAIAVASCGLAGLLMTLLSVRITRPISQLRNMMKKVERGDLDVSIPISSRDEVGQLSQSFNVMVSKLSDLGYRLYETEIREKHAQMAALQSQINPHFLYNTLGTISMYAELQGNREVVRMTNNLSRLLRYSITNSRSEVTLAEELQHVRGYMVIQQIRFEERLGFDVRVQEESLLEQPVIRLMLQPIVENSIIHGIEKGRGRGTVILSAAREEGRLVITVEDDGRGVPEADLQELRSNLRLAPLSDDIGGHGLVNVHRRIALRYGHQYGVAVDSKPFAGTKVVLTLPLATSM
ncbi:cache domain-containing sensor histidine kinase [Gordoniibacillus kamchatkensis]|uniref:cache domain-containing sensor histidine kinase n=1 Tax=Gordoniibacillus kamchatkensis TaxID=1590651 RepID=UPI000696E027|nr:sensor histidine kinase [Paenibacillus sp. VKM B-2647]